MRLTILLALALTACASTPHPLASICHGPAVISDHDPGLRFYPGGTLAERKGRLARVRRAGCAEGDRT